MRRGGRRRDRDDGSAVALLDLADIECIRMSRLAPDPPCLVPPPPSRATIVLSGSLSFAGHGAGGPDGSYPKFFIEWLNHRYPCEANDAGGGGGGRSAGPRGRGRHAAKRTTAQNSQTCFAVWNSIRDAGDSIDLVLMEFNVNDQL